jgi:hypothetical protein
VTAVKGFADACYKGEKSITRGVIYPKDKESIQKRKEIITSLVKIKLKQS